MLTTLPDLLLALSVVCLFSSLAMVRILNKNLKRKDDIIHREAFRTCIHLDLIFELEDEIKALKQKIGD